MKKQPANVESPFMSVKDVASYFCVGETTIRASRGIFGKLRRTQANGRTLIYRDSVDKLKAELDKQSYTIEGGGLSDSQLRRMGYR
jgi:hypothetical protein